MGAYALGGILGTNINIKSRILFHSQCEFLPKGIGPSIRYNGACFEGH